MLYRSTLCFLTVAWLVSHCSATAFGQSRPNVMVIYADDLGYGDIGDRSAETKIPTPHLDSLAAAGMRFTDAHSSSGICSPSRYALLTGTYHWRRQYGIVNSFGPPFFNEGETTLPGLLREAGYATACIGKWHLGWDWKFNGPPSGEVTTSWGKKQNVYLPEDVNWARPVDGGPLARGFDYYFGDGTINFPPYAWVENDRLVTVPTEMMDSDSVGYPVKEGRWEFRAGPKVAGWNPYEVLPTLAERGVAYLDAQTDRQPFFLYFALPSPHAPIIPNDAFDGRSAAGAYGDYVVQTDEVVGQLLSALERGGLADNTIVVFSSDNGPEAYAWERAAEYGHFSMGNLRGLKRDVWEGGHRVPFIVRWPGRIEAGSVSDALVSQIDLLATLTEATGIQVPEGAGPDSQTFLPVLLGQATRGARTELVHNTFPTKWALRSGDWLYLDTASGGHRDMPPFFSELMGYVNFRTPGLLFDMRSDPEQRINLYALYPKRVSEMKQQLQRLTAERAPAE